MKAFQLPPQTQAKLVKPTPHKEFDGKNPLKQAISLKMRATLALATLRQFSPHAPELFVRQRTDAQQTVEGVAPVTVERSVPELVLPVGFDIELTGYTVQIDRATGEIELYGCKLNKIKVVEIQLEGEGLGVVEWSIGSDEQITPELVGLLCAMEGNDIGIGQKAPEKPAEEATTKKERKRQKDAEAAGQQRLDAVPAHAQVATPEGDRGPAAGQASKDALDAAGNPFGTAGVEILQPEAAAPAPAARRGRKVTVE